MTSVCLDRIISRIFNGINKEFFLRLRDVSIDVDVFTAVRQLTSWIKETLVSSLEVFEVFYNTNTEFCKFENNHSTTEYKIGNYGSDKIGTSSIFQFYIL